MQVNARRDAPKRNPQSTKAGPGRRHVSGHQKASPAKAEGAPAGFVQHTVDAERRLRRANVKALGRRQAIKAVKSERSESLPGGLVG